MTVQTTRVLFVAVPLLLPTPSDLEIIHVATAPEALARVSDTRFQALVIDNRLLGALRDGAPGDPPIITIVSDESQGEQAIWGGAQGYIVRGDFDARMLRYVLRHVLERRVLQNTLLRLSEQTLDHEMRFRNLIARNADGMVVVDQQGTMRFINPAAAALCESEAAKMVGQPFPWPLDADNTTYHQLERPSGKLTVEMHVVETEWMGEVAFLATLRDISERIVMENVLREVARANSRFATTIERLGVGVLIAEARSEDNGILYINPAFSKITGYVLEDVLGKDPRILQGAQTDPAMIEAMGQAIIAQRPFEGIVLNYRKDGSIFWNKLSINPVFDEEGALMNWVGLVTDFTPIVEAEARLKQERDFSSAIINTAGSLIVVTDAAGRIVRLNPAFEAAIDYKEAEVIGQKVWEVLFPAEGRPMIQQLYQEQRYEKNLGAHIGTVQGRGGNLVRGLWRSTALYNSAGAVEYMIMTGLDITELEQAAQELWRSEARFRLLADNIPQAFFVIAPTPPRITYINPAYEIVWGRSREALYEDWGRFLDAVYDDDRLRVRTAFEQLFALELDTNFDCRIVRPDGEVRWLRVNMQVVRDESASVQQYIGMAEDITEYKRANEALLEKEKLRVALEKERELNELKGRFVSMISHELRTPLANILSSSEMLKHYRSRLSEDEFNERLERIGAQVGHLTGLMEDMLTINRAETVGLEFHPSFGDLQLLCEDLLQEMRMVYPNRQFLLTVQGECRRVWHDARLLRQAIANLLHNALKYSPAQTVVKLDLERRDATIVLQVRDQGIGIPPDDIPRLFQTFHRASNVGTIPGTGMGLTIVKYVIELHRGTVTLDSVIDSGSTFTLYLPVAPA
ncbi:MAG: PAS domain S-box protein [Chloroflexi bacterium]|nr:PAS domain S-box protein [Chloroflexota bacterium]